MDLATLIASIASIPGIGPYIVYISLALTLAVTVCSFLGMFMPPPTNTTGAYYALYTVIAVFGSLSLLHAKSLSAPSSAGIVGGAGATTGQALVATRAVPADTTNALPAAVVTVGTTAKLACMILLLCVLQACAAGQATTSVAPIAMTVSSDVAKAVQAYGIAKGIAQVAAVSDPALAPLVTAAIAKLDPYVTALQSGATLLNGVAISAAGLADQVIALENSTAQDVKVIASTVKAS